MILADAAVAYGSAAMSGCNDVWCVTQLLAAAMTFTAAVEFAECSDTKCASSVVFPSPRPEASSEGWQPIHTCEVQSACQPGPWMRNLVSASVDLGDGDACGVRDVSAAARAFGSKAAADCLSTSEKFVKAPRGLDAQLYATEVLTRIGEAMLLQSKLGPLEQGDSLGNSDCHTFTKRPRETEYFAWEGHTVSLPELDPDDILVAWYGHAHDVDRRIDVTSRIQALVMKSAVERLPPEGITICASNATWGDPAPFVWKCLHVAVRG